MTDHDSFLRLTELDETSLPFLNEQMADAEVSVAMPRSYPGYPFWKLDQVGVRWGRSLDRTLVNRRCVRELSDATLSRSELSRILYFSHGSLSPTARGPVPSAGGLQALELYFVQWTASWLPIGLYHYDRTLHRVVQIVPDAETATWTRLIPSLQTVTGGTVIWILVGDEARVEAKYLDRSGRFLLLEAGHLMQNLCLVSASMGWCTIPLGGVLDRHVSDAFQLPSTDCVLYAGVCGRPSG